MPATRFDRERPLLVVPPSLREGGVVLFGRPMNQHRPPDCVPQHEVPVGAQDLRPDENPMRGGDAADRLRELGNLPELAVVEEADTLDHMIVAGGRRRDELQDVPLGDREDLGGETEFLCRFTGKLERLGRQVDERRTQIRRGARRLREEIAKREQQGMRTAAGQGEHPDVGIRRHGPAIAQRLQVLTVHDPKAIAHRLWVAGVHQPQAEQDARPTPRPPPVFASFLPKQSARLVHGLECQA